MLRQHERHTSVRGTENDTSHEETEPLPSSILVRLLYVISTVIISLLVLRFLLTLLGANQANTFAQLIYNASQPFVAPFQGLFSYKSQYGGARFEVETLIAAAVYAIAAALITTVLMIPRRIDTSL